MITVDKKSLKLALTRLTSVIARKNRVPWLTCVAIRAVGGEMKVFGTNLDIWIESTVEVDGDLSCLVNHRQMTDLIKACPTDQIKLEIVDDDKVKVMAGKFVAVLDQHATGKPGDLAMPAFKKQTSCVLDAIVMERGTWFASTEETRYYLNGIHVARDDGQVWVSATDGHRLYRVGSKSNLKTKIDAIIPTSAARWISRYAGKGGVSIEFNQGHCRFADDDVTVVARLIDGVFPDVARVIPSGDVDGLIRVNLMELSDAANRVSAGTNKRRRYAIKIKSNGSVAEISHDGMDFMGRDEIAAETDGDPIETGFNPSYIADFAKIAPGIVDIEMRDGGKGPFIIKPEKSDDVLVLMPIKV